MSQDAYEKIWATVAGIPKGSVMSYGEVARQSGMPRHARFVSQALRKAPRNLKLPWHRVVNAQGRISFPQGSDAHKLQLSRLKREGVRFKGNTIASQHRVDVAESLDAMLWGPPPTDE